MSEKATLTARQMRAVECLLREPTTRAAATAAGVSEKTLWRWLSEPAFAQAVSGARRRLLESALAALQSASTEAVRTLQEVMGNYEAQSSARVSAARAVLEYSLRARTELEIEERLQNLEELLGPGPPTGGRK